MCVCVCDCVCGVCGTERLNNVGVSCVCLARLLYITYVTLFLCLGSQTVVEEHRGDVPSGDDVLLAVTP